MNAGRFMRVDFAVLPAIPDTSFGPIPSHSATLPAINISIPVPHPFHRAVALLERTDAGKRPVRLLGAGVHGLLPDRRPDMD